MELDESQKENLELRIEHKVIVNPAQLNSSILRLEKSNANAMDYAGKIYVFEQALANEEKIELRFAKDGKTERAKRFLKTFEFEDVKPHGDLHTD